MERIIINNATYWLNYFKATNKDAVVLESDLRNAARALEAVLPVSDAWSLTQTLALALHPYMERQGYWTDWDGFLQRLAAEARYRADPVAEAGLLLRRGTIQRRRGDYPAALITYRRAWRLFRQASNQLGRARALFDLGYLSWLQGRFWRAEIFSWSTLTLFETLGEINLLARTENHLGLVYMAQACWPEALSHLTRSRVLLEQVGDPYNLAKTLHNLGELHRQTGNSPEAAVCFRQAIDHYRAGGDEVHAARVQLNLGNVYLDQADWLQAEAAYCQAEAVLKRAGDRLDLARARHNLGMVYTRLQNWAEAEVCFARALEQWRSYGDMWNLANTLGDFVGLHMARGDWAQARHCLDEAWELAQDSEGNRYDSLRRELAERRRELRRLTGHKENEEG